MATHGETGNVHMANGAGDHVETAVPALHLDDPELVATAAPISNPFGSLAATPQPTQQRSQPQAQHDVPVPAPHPRHKCHRRAQPPETWFKL